MIQIIFYTFLFFLDYKYCKAYTIVKKEKEANVMAVLAKPVNKMVRISPEESADFVKRFNAGVITKEQRKTCEIARRLFKHENSR